VAPRWAAGSAEPGGFEGFLLRLVKRERGLLPVPNRDQPRASSLNFDAVASSHVGDVLCHHEAVTNLYRIDDLDPNLVPRREKPLRERPNLVVPPIDARPGAFRSTSGGGAEISGRGMEFYDPDVLLVLRPELPMHARIAAQTRFGNTRARTF
jgi:hypothetical protein